MIDPVAIIGPLGPIAEMSHIAPMEQQIAANLQRIDGDVPFSSGILWLTFYLTGEPPQLRDLADDLSARGWRNTDGWEGGFLYPKTEVETLLTAVVAVANSVVTMCAEKGIDLINIDADTLPDVQQSKFVTLYRA